MINRGLQCYGLIRAIYLSFFFYYSKGRIVNSSPGNITIKVFTCLSRWDTFDSYFSLPIKYMVGSKFKFGNCGFGNFYFYTVQSLKLVIGIYNCLRLKLRYFNDLSSLFISGG